ncbi:metal-dependent hydrolase [Haloarcula marina]|uniref:metal-dependent hydrolase n=1 Tax=Haloarcula marina TaxID=2961574 RepID=UPI0020B8D653|nr:metal-dependent hydrolase [Halomicroarcula marina]
MGSVVVWPWEHLAVGYLCFSLLLRVRGRRPRTMGVVAVAVGSQFPDLVDKPLGWGTTLLPSGTSLAHSLLFAVPVSILVVLATRDRYPSAGTGFALAYLAHLPCDALYGLAFGHHPRLGFLLWPLVPIEPSPPTNVLARAAELFTEFVAVLGTPLGLRFLLLEALLVGGTALLWYADGHPGLELVPGTAVGE